MKIRVMGTKKENHEFISLIKKLPEVAIYQISNSYKNRGVSAFERVYIELELNQIFTPAEVVDSIPKLQNTITLLNDKEN